MTWALAVLIAAAALVIEVRCVCVIYKAHHSNHPGSYGHFLAFGFSYIALAVASAATALATLTGVVHPVAALFVLASAGLILFDRRTRK